MNNTAKITLAIVLLLQCGAPAALNHTLGTIRVCRKRSRLREYSEFRNP
jgi:hypothetical protein